MKIKNHLSVEDNQKQKMFKQQLQAENIKNKTKKNNQPI